MFRHRIAILRESSRSRDYKPKTRVGLVKVTQSHYRPGQSLRVPGVWGSQISRQSAHEGGKVVSPTHRPPLPPRKYSWYSFLLRGWVNPRAILGPEGLCQWKIRMTPSGIEPATFRLVEGCLNQLRHRVPPVGVVIRLIFLTQCLQFLDCSSYKFFKKRRSS